MLQSVARKQKRVKRVRGKILTSKNMPRLSVFRSNKGIYAQIIDDTKGVTLVSASDHGIKAKLTKTEKAEKVGQIIAEKAVKLKIKKIVFDRGPFAYHGRVRAVATGARKGGLVF